MNNTISENSPFNDSLIYDIGPLLIILQLNVEGLIKDKSSYLARFSRPQGRCNVDIPDEEQKYCRGKIDGFKLASDTYHKHYETAT